MSLIIQVPQDLYSPLESTKTFKKIDIPYVLENTSIVDLALEYGIDLIEQTGGDYVALCPFHDDKDTPSFRVYEETGTWFCFGCQQGSSVFDFIMQQEGIEFQEALQKLAGRLGYDGTYALGTLKTSSNTEKFSLIREKIELAILQKYLYIYRGRQSLGTVITDEKIDVFWKWYDRAQVVFNQKEWKGEDPEILENKFYKFYSRALQELDFLDEEKCYGS